MFYLYTLLIKILFLIILTGIGIVLKLKNQISDHGLSDMSKMNMNVFWPSLILSSLISGVDRTTLYDNLMLPVFAAVTAFTGFFLGYVFCRINRWEGSRKNIFLYHSTINNFVFIVLPFLNFFLPKTGAGLLFIHNLGYMLILWTLGISFMTHSMSLGQKLKHLMSTGLIATVAGILIAILGINRFIPSMVLEIFKILGNCTVPVAMIIAGGQIANLGVKAFKFDSWNIQLGIVRLVLVPGILAFVTVILDRYTSISTELLIVFMTVNLAPVSVNAVSMAIFYKADADLAAEGVVFTHLFSIGTMLFFFWIMGGFFTTYIR